MGTTLVGDTRIELVIHPYQRCVITVSPIAISIIHDTIINDTLALPAGFEPTTLELTALCSAVELRENILAHYF